jgi:hypothetical protein
MMHKIRSVIGFRDDQYSLTGEVELYDGFFETVSIHHNKEEPLKRGRGSQKQTKVIVAAKSRLVEDESITKEYSTNRRLGFVSMKVVNSLSIKQLIPVVADMIEEGSDIITDGSNSFNELKSNYNHQPHVVKPKDAPKKLPWVHKDMSNAKRLLLDVHHRIDDDFLQNYLNVFS